MPCSVLGVAASGKCGEESRKRRRPLVLAPQTRCPDLIELPRCVLTGLDASCCLLAPYPRFCRLLWNALCLLGPVLASLITRLCCSLRNSLCNPLCLSVPLHLLVLQVRAKVIIDSHLLSVLEPVARSSPTADYVAPSVTSSVSLSLCTCLCCRFAPRSSLMAT